MCLLFSISMRKFTRHFCLSEVKRAKEVDSLQSSREVGSTVLGMTRTTMNENGVDDGEDSNQPIQKALSMTSLFRVSFALLQKVVFNIFIDINKNNQFLLFTYMMGGLQL